MLRKNIKFIAFAVACVLLLPLLSACSQDGTPDGYQLVVGEGDKFRLYVPTQWTPNISGGITGAIYSLTENASVNVYVAEDADGMTIDEYWIACDERYRSELQEYEPNEKVEKILLGGKEAHKHVYSARISVRDDNSGETEAQLYKFMQIMAIYDGEMYVLLYSAPEQYYDSHVAEVEGDSDGVGIVPYFIFAEPYVSDENAKKISNDVVAPDGMKLISTDERAYRFFVPTDWIVNDRTEATAAYASENDSSNVSVQMYMTSNESQTVEEYWTVCEDRYMELFAEYELISSSQIIMDGISAMRYDIFVSTGGDNYKITQAIVKKGIVFYCITYTALTENYEKHAEDVQRMIENFDIR